LIFSEPASVIDTLLLRVPPYQIVSRLMVVAIFAVLGSSILEFMVKKQSAEGERQKAHHTLLTVLNSIDATIYVANMRNHKILFMNQNMIDSFGRDMTGEICWEVFRGNTKPCQECTNDQLIDDNGRPTGVCTWQDKNPIVNKWYINNDRAIEWTDGQLVRLQIATDITDLKVMEQQVQQAQKIESIGNLSGGIAHDFNNILFPIVGMSEMLIDDLSPTSPECEMAREILKAALRGSDLVKQILAFSRQTEHKMMPVRVQQIMKEVLKLSRSSIPSDIEIIHDINNECGLVMADPTQLHQIAMNLVTNAYHAVELNGGKISVQLEETDIENDDLAGVTLEPGGYAKLTISDTGSGIEPAIIDRIFEPYFTTKEQGKGTGLGLAVVYGIVREHNGEIKVYSEPEKGTTFNVYLPLLERSAEAIPAKEPEAGITGHERILLVDDEDPIVRLEKEILERLGYRVTSQTSSVDALDTFRSNPDAFDLVITDMTMPNMTGDQLAKKMLSIKPDMPVIICTGFSERMSREKAAAIGVVGFLMKPVAKTEMAKMVRNMLDEIKISRQD
jgi:signal transduction histidine kinase/ActR/RegA family two-component response regulator